MDNPFISSLDGLANRLGNVKTTLIEGRVVKSVGTTVRCVIPHVRVGDLCEFSNELETLCFGEVIGFDGDEVIVALLGEPQGISPKTRVVACDRAQTVLVSDDLIGRVLDATGKPMDGKPAVYHGTPRPIYADPPSPLERQLISQPFETRVRAIDSTLTIGEGQRVGIFAAAGVGKSTLLSQLVKGAQCDVCVVALIGERGREVREFVEHDLGEEGMRKTVIVCATSDRSALERARGAYLATAIAEHFRDEGKKVLLLMDSVTRFARALREIGLSAGEPPTRAGFPPSVFATLPRLLERSGMGKNGSITAVYTVLVEGDDMTEPIADETRSILDGHIVLSRHLAQEYHYPAIDILQSVSRVMPNVTEKAHRDCAGKLRSLLSAYQKAEVLIRIGEYKNGSDPLVDEAIAKMPTILEFLRQETKEFTPYLETQERLQSL